MDMGLWWPHAALQLNQLPQPIQGSRSPQSHPGLSLLSCAQWAPGEEPLHHPLPLLPKSLPGQQERAPWGEPLPCSPLCAFWEVTCACCWSFSSVTLGWGCFGCRVPKSSSGEVG